MLIMIDLYLRHSTLERTPVVNLYKGFLTFKTNHMQRRAVIVHAHSASQHSLTELNEGYTKFIRLPNQTH